MFVKNSITIIGGGLAGLALAAGLRRYDVPVVVHEAGRYPRHRVCGEFLSGLKQSTLERLGIADCFADARLHRSVQWSRQGGAISHHRLPEPALALSRFRLDQRLCDRARSLGAIIHEGSRLHGTTEPGTVWSAGRKPVRGSWIGLKGHVTDGLELNADLEMHLGGNGYVGMAGVEDGRVNVCGLFRLERSLSGKGGELLLSCLRAGGHQALAQRLKTAATDEASFCAIAGFGLGWQSSPVPQQCVIGDAGAMIPPFTGNGMTMALQSAEIALEPLVSWSQGKLLWSAARKRICNQLRTHFRTRMAVSCAVNPLLVQPFTQRWIATFARRGWLPVRPILQLVH
ncbi:MAG: flavin-dependent dehydrogenase [Verrucomicrobiales bacterium]